MHPLTRIIAVMFLAILVQVGSPAMLGVTGILLLFANVRQGSQALFRLLRRSRWLMLMLLAVYAFATPGEYVAGWPFTTAPTYEGMHAGIFQLVRLAIMLGGIALLLTMTPRDDLIAGIYMLLMPLRFVASAPEKFAARLWLTLHYVEQKPLRQQWQGWRSFSQIAESQSAPNQDMLLEIPRLRVIDWSLLVLMCSLALCWSLS